MAFLLQRGTFTDLVVLPRIFLQIRGVKLLCGQVPEMRGWNASSNPAAKYHWALLRIELGGINNITAFGTASFK